MLFKFKKKVKVEGHGTYEIEITNLVNPQTQTRKSILPSVLDVSTQNAFKATKCKRQIEQQVALNPPSSTNLRTRLKHVQNDPYAGLPYSRQQCQAVEELGRLLKRKMMQNFNKLKLESVTYKREREEKKHLKIIQIENIIKRKLLLNKMQALQSIKNYSHSNSMSSD